MELITPWYFFAPDLPGPPETSMTLNYSVSGINSTKTSNFLSIGFLDQDDDSPFDFHRWQVSAGLTKVHITNIFATLPFIED
ncbi:12920_t:CDS:1 [Dentiscutata erythropus]|uniref:12920_t:CDS:1 n=1 Tax=Dentiscutata erythropus TaxID=1348616 RepID=A0A9N9C810_9GLOM|nr:12920_t:CDS:1 [Dentiscutata erythropus]